VVSGGRLIAGRSPSSTSRCTHFLEYADRGSRALGDAVAGSVGGFDSPFEQAVARGLRERGWTVVPQIGVSRFRIDLGVVHPDLPGDFLIGVECDGATYHRAATACDRDKVRAAVLKSLGWSLVRVWSTDWWIDSSGALDRLHVALSAVLETSRETLREAQSKAAPRLGGEEHRPATEADASIESTAIPTVSKERVALGAITPSPHLSASTRRSSRPCSKKRAIR